MRKTTKQQATAMQIPKNQHNLNTPGRSNPERLMDLQVAATVLGILVNVSTLNNTPTLTFYFNSDTTSIDNTLSYVSEEYKFDSLELEITELLEAHYASLARKELAVATWNEKLTQEEQTAIKEHIYWMK